MGLFRPLRLFFALLAFSALFTLASAQEASVRGRISDGQPLRDNVLLFPLNGQLAGNRIAGLLVPLKLWSRQQEVTCATNHSACEGAQFCCPDGNVCCSGELFPVLCKHIYGGDVGDDSYELLLNVGTL